MRIVAENLAKRFNRDWVFRNLNQTFEPGQTYAIVGPNGSGKSTLLQVLWGQLPPSSGWVHYQGDDTSIPADEIYSLISIAAPYLELIEEFTLREMMRFHFRFKKPRSGMDERSIIDRMELRHAADKPISNFSTGMRQRLKLGLALMSDCPILFLDEPTTNLDLTSIAWYWELFRQLPGNQLIFIASNQEQEYPADATKIDISAYK